MQIETKRIYHIDSYARRFNAQVISCQPEKDHYEIILDQTAFYPEGGGQPADQGTLAGITVKDVREKGFEIIHLTDSPLPIGAQVEGEIDWQLRFERMQHHTGEHMVSGIVNRLFGFDNVGFRMGSEGVTIDFNGVLSETMLDQVEWMGNEAIYQNYPVKIEYPDPVALSRLTYRSKKEIEGALRIVFIPETDQCACCGTHLKSSGEVGMIKLIKFEKNKGGTRVTMLCGFKALLDYRDKAKSISAISGCLSAKPSEVSQAVEKVTQELLLAKKKMAAIKMQLWEQKAAQIGMDSERAVVFEEDLSADDLRQFCQILINQVKLAIVLSPYGAAEYKYAIRSDFGDIRPEAAMLNKRFSGRGGGTAAFCQGSIQGKKEEIEAFLTTRFN